MKLRIFETASIVSLLLFGAVAWMWVRSFAEDRALVSWTRAGDRYTLRSHRGQLVLAAPAVVDAAPAADLESISARMSNEDFDWTPLGGGFVQGDVREGTATWDVYAYVRGELGDEAKRAAAVRVWLRGLEDPQTFAASHLMLLLAAEDRWRARWVDEAKQPWREASAAGDRLILFAKADGTGSGPDASGVGEVRDRWHALLYEARTRLFVGWVALAALALPVAWAARPRREPRTRMRWGFNALTIVSVLLLVVSAVLWARSYGTGEQWMFAARPGVRAPGTYVKMRVQCWVGTVKGRLVLCEHEVPDMPDVGFSMRPRPVGYKRTVIPIIRAQSWGATPKDERHWKIAGIEYCGMPAQELVGPPMPMPLAAGGGVATSHSFYGFRYLFVDWWTPVLLASLLPLLWLFGYVAWRLRERRARRLRDKICLNCGYDLRASAGRCSECGTPVPGDAA
jgi:hypothetical protein